MDRKEVVNAAFRYVAEPRQRLGVDFGELVFEFASHLFQLKGNGLDYVCYGHGVSYNNARSFVESMKKSTVVSQGPINVIKTVTFGTNRACPVQGGVSFRSSDAEQTPKAQFLSSNS